MHTKKEGSGKHCKTRQQGADAASSNYFKAKRSQPALAGYSQPTAIQNSGEMNQKRLNWWRILKECAVKVTAPKNRTFLAFRFKTFLLYIGYQPSKMTVAFVSVVDCDRWLPSQAFLVWGHSWKLLHSARMYDAFPSLLLCPSLGSNCALWFKRKVESQLR